MKVIVLTKNIDDHIVDCLEMQDRFKQVEDLWRLRMDCLLQLLAQRELFQADIERCLRWLKEADIITFPSINVATSFADLEQQLNRFEVRFVMNRHRTIIIVLLLFRLSAKNRSSTEI